MLPSALLGTLVRHIFALSLRCAPESSSLGPAKPRYGLQPNPPPSIWSTGRWRFLLPRPFAPLFAGSIFGSSPFFFVGRLPTSRRNPTDLAKPKHCGPLSPLHRAHTHPSRFAFVPHRRPRHKRLTRLRSTPSGSPSEWSPVSASDPGPRSSPRAGPFCFPSSRPYQRQPIRVKQIARHVKNS